MVFKEKTRFQWLFPSDIPTPNSVYTNYNEGDRVSLLLIPTNIIVIPGNTHPIMSLIRILNLITTPINSC